MGKLYKCNKMLKDTPLIKAILARRDMMSNMRINGMSLDEVITELYSAGRFKVTKAYHRLRKVGDRVNWHTVIWDARHTPRHAFIAWMATLKRLSTHDRMQFLDIDPVCHLCRWEVESHDHLFFRCRYSRDIWREIRRTFGMASGLGTLDLTLRWLRRKVSKKDRRSSARCFAFVATVYYIWHARHSLIFEGNRLPEDVVMRLIKTHVFRLLHTAFPGYESDGIRGV